MKLIPTLIAVVLGAIAGTGAAHANEETVPIIPAKSQTLVTGIFICDNVPRENYKGLRFEMPLSEVRAAFDAKRPTKGKVQIDSSASFVTIGAPGSIPQLMLTGEGLYNPKGKFSHGTRTLWTASFKNEGLIFVYYNSATGELRTFNNCQGKDDF